MPIALRLEKTAAFPVKTMISASALRDHRMSRHMASQAVTSPAIALRRASANACIEAVYRRSSAAPAHTTFATIMLRPNPRSSALFCRAFAAGDGEEWMPLWPRSSPL